MFVMQHYSMQLVLVCHHVVNILSPPRSQRDSVVVLVMSDRAGEHPVSLVLRKTLVSYSNIVK